MILSCIVVDDDPIALNLLQKLCEQHESLELLAVFLHAQEAIEFLQKEVVDLIWLDVEMPHISGFDLLKNIVSEPQVIMTTSSVEYAYEAYQQKVSDYIQKPISISRFKAAVEKVLKIKPTELDSNKRKDIFVKVDGKYLKLVFSEILYIENLGDYVKIITLKNIYTVHSTMKYLEEKLGYPFIRVHRSFIVNIDKIIDIEENNLVIGSKVIPVSRANKSELMSKLNLL
jgi:DNA-binding LytR/AlgR family response regulator